MVEGVDTVGLGISGTTGTLASGELHKGCDAGKPKPWAEGGDRDEDNDELVDIGETISIVNELLDGGETSFLSGDRGDVVVSSSLP